MSNTPEPISPEAQQIIQAAREAYEAQQALYAQEEAARWALLQTALDNCAQEMARREEAYDEAMGEP